MSGINKGCNLGDDVTYSGTVAGALEGGAARDSRDRGVAAERRAATSTSGHRAAGGALVAEALLRRPLPARTFLNVNVPCGPPQGFRTTVQAQRNHVTVGRRARIDPQGRGYYWIDEGQDDWQPHDRSDYQAVRERLISVTPLHPDLTAHDALEAARRLPLRARADGKIAHRVSAGLLDASSSRGDSIVRLSGRGSAW